MNQFKTKTCLTDPYVLLWFTYWVLIIFDQFWGNWKLGRIYGPSPIFEPLQSKAILSLLMAAVVGGLAYCRGLLGKLKPHRRYLVFLSCALLVAVSVLFMEEFDLSMEKFGSSPTGMLIIFVVWYLVGSFFYSPLIGLARLVPALETRILSNSYDPLVALIIGLTYAAFSVFCFHLGTKARKRTIADMQQADWDMSVAQSEQVETTGKLCGEAVPPQRENLRQRLSQRLPALLCALSVLFFVLWIAEVQDKSELALLVKTNAKAVRAGFVDFQSSGEEPDYWRAVADFKAFEQTYSLYCEKAGRPESGAQCSVIAGVLSTDPEKAKPYLEEIYDHMRFWVYSLGSEKSYTRMAELHAIMTQ